MSVWAIDFVSLSESEDGDPRGVSYILVSCESESESESDSGGGVCGARTH